MEKAKSSSKKVDQSKAKSRPPEHVDGHSAERHSFNPFEGRNKEEVWKEISKNGTSMSQPEMIKHLRSLTDEQKRDQ